jgi:glutamyl-tRNA synthetase
VIDGEIDPVIEDADYCRQAAALLPDEIFDATTWSRWTGAIKAQSGRKGRALFHPLRLALTGRDQGPELAVLLPLIGRSKAEARLCAHAGSSHPAP